jgi:hypothetical protein
MPLVIPAEDPDEPPFDQPLELKVLRRQTKWFIRTDPTTITLIPVRKVKNASAGFTRIDQAPRPPQVFKLITLNENAKPTIVDDGVERLVDFQLLGEWSAQMDVGDYWRDEENQKYEIVELVPTNLYETRGMVVKHGHG